jgi:hypothetical protein
MPKIKYLSGTNGRTWVNGELLSNVTSMQLKLQSKTDDVAVCGNFGTGTAMLSYSAEGTLKLNKCDSTLVKTIFDSIITGVAPDIKIIIALNDPATGKTESYAINDVIFTELDVNYEAQKTVEQELPFKAGEISLLKTMD